MPRVTRVLGHGERRGAAIDTLILNAEQRRDARGTATGLRGTRVELDLPPGTILRHDDVVELDTGEMVEIVAEAEPLHEIRADIATLARIAWTLGDRHIPVQILPSRIRFRRDAADERLTASLGTTVLAIEAPFEPEGGAYAVDHAGHAHAHDHDHDHDHHHHEHGHAHPHRHGADDAADER
jgi:urease accessory protein